MTAPCVLLVEDDHGLRDLVSRGLRQHGFVAVTATDGESALRTMDSTSIDAVVLDIGLPDSDGRDVCLAMRGRGVDVPVLFLTARQDVGDRLSGFAAGGDDYLAKPFALEELLARLTAIMRRHVNAVVGSDAALRVDPVAHCVRLGAASVDLSPTELKLLSRLLAERGAVVRRQQLRAAAWPAGAIVAENTLDQYITKLRRKLAELGATETVRSARGVGFQVVSGE